MRLDGRESDNIEDDRGDGGGGGGGGGFRIAGGGLGAIVLFLVAAYFGIDPRQLASITEGGGQSGPAPSSTSRPAQPAEDRSAHEGDERHFVAKVLAETEDTWTAVLARSGKQYVPPKLVLYRDQVQSGCGSAQSSAGPFYCPPDRKVYLDLTFLDELSNRFHAPGDFAAAYVIAHEVGHHVQNLLGISEKAQQAEQDPRQRNAISVRVELQADCFAGVWAKNADSARHILEQGDIESGLAAASAVGDDRLQRQATGTVRPDTFTHGSSAQRVKWFKTGLESGEIKACDTFGREP